MNVTRFFFLIRVLVNTQLVLLGTLDDDGQWLMDNGYIQSAGSSSIKLTEFGTLFLLGRFQKILDLP